MPNKTMAEFIEELRKNADAAFPYDVDYMNVVNGIADDLEEVWEREREKADAKIADLQSRVKLWTDRSAELVKKCNEHYANAHKSERGDRAKLREALSTAIILLMACEWPDDAPMKDIAEVMDEIGKALAAPQRNCDRFADELDAQLAFLNEVWLISIDRETMTEQDAYENWTDEMRTRYGRWLLAPATEQKGDNDGSK